MGLVKRTYTDNVTVITAENLNNIQDEIILQGQKQAEDEATLALKADKSTTYTKTEVNSALSGIIDPTLSIAGKAADAKKTGGEISDLINIIGSKAIKFTAGYYIATNGGVGSTVTLTPTANGSFSYAIVDCVAGDEIVLNARGWTTGRLWAFLDSSNKIISVSVASVTASNLILIAPTNTAKCVINSYNSSLGNCYLGVPVPLVRKQLQSEINGIEGQICAVYNNYEQGTINSQGTPVANNSTMRSVDFIPLNRVKSISVGFQNYIYLRLYDAYGYYVGAITALGYGDGYPNNTVNYNSIKTQYPAAYNLKITISGASAVTPSTLSSTGLKFEYYLELNARSVVVDINGKGDYTSILRALKETPPTTKVIVKQGVYDQIAEYEDYYGSDFWTNYAGYGGLEDDFLRGYFVSEGRVLQFESGAVVEFLYDGANTNVDQYFSPLASGYDATIIGGYIKYSHARYGLHDDAARKGGVNIFDGIIFDGSNVYYGNQIGGGMGKANTYYLKNLIFIDDNVPAGNGDLYYHNNADASAENRLFMQNCYGERGARFLWYGDSTKTTYCIASGNHFSHISCAAHSAEPHNNENITLIKYNNTETNEE